MLSFERRVTGVFLAFLLSLLAGDAFGAASNPAVGEPGVFFGVDIGKHYPEFGVSALRFHMMVLQLSRGSSEDTAIKAAAVAFRKYEGMLSGCYGTEEWMEVIKRGLEKLGEATETETSAYVENLLEKMTKRPSLRERRKLTDAALSLYNELLTGSSLQSSSLNSSRVMFGLYDFVLGMIYKIARE